MALKHVNAVIVGAGAGGGVVAKELSTAGLSVVLLERGKWYSAADCRKDDLHNQRTTVLGNGFGPDDERNPRVLVDEQGETDRLPQRSCLQQQCGLRGRRHFQLRRRRPGGSWRRTSACARPTERCAGSTLEDWPIGYADLEPYYDKAEWELGVSGDETNNIFRGPRRKPLPMPPLGALEGAPDPAAGRQAPRAASVRHPDVAKHSPVQRTQVVHAVPMVLGFACELSARTGTHNTVIPDGAGHRELRAPDGMCSQGDSARRPGARRPGLPTSTAMTAFTSNQPTWCRCAEARSNRPGCC